MGGLDFACTVRWREGCFVQPPPGQHLPSTYIFSLLVGRDGTLGSAPDGSCELERRISSVRLPGSMHSLFLLFLRIGKVCCGSALPLRRTKESLHNSEG